MTKRKLLSIIVAYENGMTLPAISQMFKITKHEIILIIHSYWIGKKSEVQAKKLGF